MIRKQDPEVEVMINELEKEYPGCRKRMEAVAEDILKTTLKLGAGELQAVAITMALTELDARLEDVENSLKK